MIGTGSNISPGKRLCRLLLKQSDLSLFLQGSSTCFTHKQNDKCRLQYSCNLSTNKALTEPLVWLYFCSSHLFKNPWTFFADSSPSPSPRARPVPGGGRPKPSVKAAKPRGTVLYDYSAGDTDEISLCQGEIVEILQEGS